VPSGDVVAKIRLEPHVAARRRAAAVGRQRHEVELDVERRRAGQVAHEQTRALQHAHVDRTPGDRPEIAGDVQAQLAHARGDLLRAEQNTNRRL